MHLVKLVVGPLEGSSWSISQWSLLRTKSQWIFKFCQTTCLHFKSCQNKNIARCVTSIYSHFGHSWNTEVAKIRGVNQFWKALHQEGTSQALGEAARRNLVFKATFISFRLSRVLMIPCCYSCVLLNDPSLGRTLLNPGVWASGRQDELLGGWTQTARSKDLQAGAEAPKQRVADHCWGSCCLICCTTLWKWAQLTEIWILSQGKCSCAVTAWDGCLSKDVGHDNTGKYVRKWPPVNIFFLITFLLMGSVFCAEILRNGLKPDD